MADVSSVYNENANLRKIQNNLLKWDASEDPLAPLTKNQELLIAKLGHTVSFILIIIYSYNKYNVLNSSRHQQLNQLK